MREAHSPGREKMEIKTKDELVSIDPRTAAYFRIVGEHPMEVDISVCKCVEILPDWSNIFPELTEAPCHGHVWSVHCEHGLLFQACDFGGSRSPDDLLIPLTGYTSKEFLAL